MVIVLALIAVNAIIAGIAVLRPGLGIAIGLAALSGLLLPVNNGRLEGPVLYTVQSGHGLTVSDLIAYAGFIVAAWTVARWLHAQVARSRSSHRLSRTGVRRSTGVAWVAAGLAVIAMSVLLGGGALVAWTHGSV
jgi:hypothetical protein